MAPGRTGSVCCLATLPPLKIPAPSKSPPWLTPAENPSPQQKPLTPREVQVLNLLAASKTHTAIAFELGVREHTALAHIRNLRVKLGAKNKLDAVLKGIRSGIVTE